jgi:pimeloyl-ACP methyl ester carboxylesterase
MRIKQHPVIHLIYLHAFASSAGGSKVQYLRPRLAERSDATFHAVEFSPMPADFEYLTITGMINRLRQYILDRELTDVCLIGSSMGGLVGLNYAHRYGGVAYLLLLSPALTYLSGERVGLSLDEWQADGVGQLFHYGFNRPVRLRYDLEVDGRFYTPPHRHHQPPSPSFTAQKIRSCPLPPAGIMPALTLARCSLLK